MQTYSAIIFDTLIRILRFWFISFNAFVDWNNQWIIASISIYHALTSETAFLIFFRAKLWKAFYIFFFRLKQANSIRRRVHGKVQEDAAMGTPGTWRKNRSGEHCSRHEFRTFHRWFFVVWFYKWLLSSMINHCNTKKYVKL